MSREAIPRASGSDGRADGCHAAHRSSLAHARRLGLGGAADPPRARRAGDAGDVLGDACRCTSTAWDAPGEPVPLRRGDGRAGRRRPGRSASARSGAGRGARRGSASRPTCPPSWAGDRSSRRSIDLGFHPDSAGLPGRGTGVGAGLTARCPLQGVHPRRTGVPLPDAPGRAAGARAWRPRRTRRSRASAPARPPRLAGHRRRPAALHAAPGRRSALRDDDVFHLLLDVEVLLGLMTALPLDGQAPPAAAARRSSRRSTRSTSTTSAAPPPPRAAVLAPALALPARDGAHHVIGVGHAHIDTRVAVADPRDRAQVRAHLRRPRRG